MTAAVIFDLDGLLIDSEPLWRSVEREVFAEVGVELSEADCRTTTGLRCDLVVAHWFERRPWSGPGTAEVQRRIEERMRDRIQREGRPLPGAVEAVGRVAAAGLRLAVASSSDRRLIDAALQRLGLDRVIRVRCSAVDEAAPKPAPDVYLRAAAALGLAPANCLAVEDSAPGVAAALAAGMRVVAVPDPEHRCDPGIRRAHRVLDSLDELEIGG